jgi:hypothetical protein
MSTCSECGSTVVSDGRGHFVCTNPQCGVAF